MNDHDEILRMMLRAIATKMVGDVDEFAFKFIRRSTVLQMPDRESLKALGDAAEYFSDNGAVPDGDLILQAAHRFSQEQIVAALDAGGTIVSGYKFEYPSRVLRSDTNLPGWCGYLADNIGFATSFEISIIVCAISRMNKEQK